MSAREQFLLFLCCVPIGFVGGIFYEIFSCLRYLFDCKGGKRSILTGIFDVAFFSLFALFTVWLSTLLKFPAFRAYMGVGYAVGLILYLKSMHRILDFFEKTCYNRIKIAVKRRKIRKNLKKPKEKEVGKVNDRRKIKKNHHRRRGRGNDVARIPRRRDHLSDRRYQRV